MRNSDYQQSKRKKKSCNYLHRQSTWQNSTIIHDVNIKRLKIEKFLNSIKGILKQIYH